MKNLRLIIVLFLISVLLVAGFLWYWNVSCMDIYRINAYGHPKPYNFIGMTREQVFEWADANRYPLYDDFKKGKIALGGDDWWALYENIDEVVENFGKEHILSLDYVEIFSRYYSCVVKIEKNVVVCQYYAWYGDF